MKVCWHSKYRLIKLQKHDLLTHIFINETFPPSPKTATNIAYERKIGMPRNWSPSQVHTWGYVLTIMRYWSTYGDGRRDSWCAHSIASHWRNIYGWWRGSKGKQISLLPTRRYCLYSILFLYQKSLIDQWASFYLTAGRRRRKKEKDALIALTNWGRWVFQ